MNNRIKIIELTQSLKSLIPESSILQIDLISDCQLKLHEKEILIINNMSRGRQREFTAGRIITKNILEKMGIYNFPLMKNVSGYPIWPFGIVGSISHKGSVCAVLLANNKKYISLGIDLEKSEPLEQDIWEVFSTSDQMTQAFSFGIEKEMFANMVFSAKESVYKCLSPIYSNKTPSMRDIKLKLFANTEGYFPFTYSFKGSKVIGRIVVNNEYTISWCSISSP